MTPRRAIVLNSASGAWDASCLKCRLGGGHEETIAVVYKVCVWANEVSSLAYIETFS